MFAKPFCFAIQIYNAIQIHLNRTVDVEHDPARCLQQIFIVRDLRLGSVKHIFIKDVIPIDGNITKHQAQLWL